MEKMRKTLGLPRLRLPTYAQLWDKSWWAKVICPLNFLFSLTTFSQEVEADREVSWVVEFETRFAQAQEVALWSRYFGFEDIVKIYRIDT